MSVQWQHYSGKKFFTLGAFKKKEGSTNRLLVDYNETNDVLAVKEILNPDIVKWYKPDLDLQRHEVKPPGSQTTDAFVRELIVKAELYKKNEAKKHVPYNLIDENCACWVNSLFKACGVDQKTRLKAGEFSGVDWGEEDEIDASYFR